MDRATASFLERVRGAFPAFADRLGDGKAVDLENVGPPATDAELRVLESRLGLPLPASYKNLLRCGRSFWLLGGVVQFDTRHPFKHRFPTLAALTPAQRRVVQQKGGAWPPPSEGMVCLAELALEADGDQVLFDVINGLVDGEYPVVYYAHDARPPSVRRLADSFPAFLDTFLDDRALAASDDEGEDEE